MSQMTWDEARAEAIAIMRKSGPNWIQDDPALYAEAKDLEARATAAGLDIFRLWAA
jgi:hypothetical protein